MALTSELVDLPFKVVENKFTYLGIPVTSKHKNLFKENFLPLLSHVKQCLTQWSPLSTPFVRWINSVKMTILLKFQYLFQSLPVFIPKSFFETLDSILSFYIWRGKRPCLNKSHLQKSKDSGGMALPNFWLYYWAANIRAVKCWSHFHCRTNGRDWVADELNAVQNFYLGLAQILTYSPFTYFNW